MSLMENTVYTTIMKIIHSCYCIYSWCNTVYAGVVGRVMEGKYRYILCPDHVPCVVAVVTVRSAASVIFERTYRKAISLSTPSTTQL